ncbi:glutamine and serine-rich protein 1-like isoform X2 [Xenopus laevis]|uniref:Glutamine and serine-rich protein 1-like isoform X2 n=1 Tax=Xenopus laevis TaxID=8355 RepID=A0A8J0V095_XENLA|nr:glutamine and serine-rich protein 1-like isoform X2 [Xenopus laevis]
MDRNYPTPTFTDPLASASPAAWAYERSAAGIKPSLSYGAGHPTHSETELLHRQTYAAAHQLPGYATTHHPTGLSGIFDTSLHMAGSNTTETSVMNFLSAIESRTAQAASSGTTLLPQFRAPSWQTGFRLNNSDKEVPAFQSYTFYDQVAATADYQGMHSSTATELFVTGALQTSGTFPTSALTAYQHPNTFSSRNFATTPSLALQDGTFSAATNGLLSPHDPLLQIKTSQTPTALTFERIGGAVLSTSIPQSSTYRSAQESAPHLLQPQFSLLPTALGGTQQPAQPYSTSVFTGSTASIERALQRECSVIKHHQRPSSTQSVQAQLSGAQHSLPNYLTSLSGVSLQDASRQASLLCTPLGLTQVSNGGPVQKTSQVSLELSQSYPSVIPSPGYPPSSTKSKNCPTKAPPRSSKPPKSQSVVSPEQTQSYTKSSQNQSSVNSSQAQAFSTAQLPSLLSVSQSPIYVSTQSPNLPSASQSQVFSTIKTEKLPPLYKPLIAFSSQSQTITSGSQTLSYPSDQSLSISSVSSETYSDQTRDLSSANQSQSYSSNNSQGLTSVSQSQVIYSSQSQVMSPVSPSNSYTSGQNLTLASPSLPFSASSRGQNLSASSPTQNFISMHPTPNTQDPTSPQSQKFLPSVQPSSFASPPHSQAMQNSRTTADSKSYVKRKSDTNLYASAKQEEKFQIQDLQALQQTTLETATPGLGEGELNTHETAYSVSKADDRYSQSVIKSNSRMEEQVLSLQGTKKEECLISPVGHMSQHVSHLNNSVSHDGKKNTDLIQSTQVSAKDLSQHNMLQKVLDTKMQEQPSTSPQLQAAMRHSQHLQLLDSGCDLQMFQQSILQSNMGQTKPSTQMQQIQSPPQVAHAFLQMDGQIIQSNGAQAQQSLHAQGSEVIKMDTSDGKHLQQHLHTKDHFSQRGRLDSKNQFDSLNPMCFSESMLLSDERNFLSHVDDILAATAAQEFAKSSNEENLSVKNQDAKSRFQSLNVRHMSPTFAPPKPQNMNSLSLNGSQTAINLSTVSTAQTKNVSLDQTRIQPMEQDLQSGMVSPVPGANQEDHEKNSEKIKTQSSVNQEPKEGGNIPEEVRDAQFLSNNKTLSEENTTPEGDFIMGGDENTALGQVPSQHLSKIDPQAGGSSTSQMEEDCPDLSQDGLQKGKDKMPIKQFTEDENANLKQIKRNMPLKRPVSKGPDVPGVQYSSHVSEGYYDSYQHQERMRQKIKEVEEKQPEVKSGFIASFLDFLKTGPKQQFSAPAVRVPGRVRRPCTPVIRPPCPGPLPQQSAAGAPVPDSGNTSSPKKAEEDLKKNLETLPSFSSDEDDANVGNNDLQKSISTALSALDENSEKRLKTGDKATLSTKQEPSTPRNGQDKTKAQESVKPSQPEPTQPEQLAKLQETIAIEGFTDEENTESGGEGMYRERDEFVVKIEDIEMLTEALRTGKEPPAIWKVQKALLQKFIPEIRDGQRSFAATNSYLGYFGDAKTKYKRVYVKFVENANKKEYVRVCSRKPKSKVLPPARTTHTKASGGSKVSETPPPKSAPPKVVSAKPKAKQQKTKAEPPPKKRKQWKEEFSSSQSDSSPDMQSDEEEFEPPPPPIVTRFLNTRAMKETFKGYIELLVGLTLDGNMMQNLEKENDDVLLPHMRKIEGMLNENRRRLLTKLQLEQPLKNALENYPDFAIISRETKGKSGGAAACKIKVNGKWYNKKTLRPAKNPSKQSQEFPVQPEKSQLCSLYHALHHYKYHIYLICKEEVSSVQKANRDLKQEELVNHCLKKIKWVEELFEKFGELLSRVQQTCS